ncbi:hypothetical protein DPMN_127540 [Dreissena polymorpha]|uniref:Uncharacterized protein n=1 Tax=Dreissena polymorpha TaxID=45954 RepID=A0A9D4H276_DREPO|nr:hypothetical protein DPMN_127540 [Dreissena polymorpha]
MDIGKAIYVHFFEGGIINDKEQMQCSKMLCRQHFMLCYLPQRLASLPADTPPIMPPTAYMATVRDHRGTIRLSQ